MQKHARLDKMKQVFIIILAVLLIVGAFVYSSQKTITASALDDPTTAKFNYLVANRNSACYGMSTVMKMEDNGRIMGSCCGPMILHTYKEQLEALKKYESINVIPKDPYDISVSWAKKMINAFKTIQLSDEQQKTYEDAKKMSKEGGPCCCGSDELDESCWRWKTYGGLAKVLITKYNFNAEQIAEIWDMSDGCGGD